MARPTKQGIDYFPVDVQFDEKVELYITETESAGLGILLTIWQLIYQNDGYYIKAGNDLFLLVKRRVLTDVSIVENAVNVAVNRGIFDRKLFKKHKILTSKAIQKRFFTAVKKKKTVSVNKNYIYTGINSGENWVSDSGNATKEDVDVEVKEYIVEKKVIAYLNKKTGKKFRETETNLKLITARLSEGFSEKDFITAINNQNDIWGDDDKMKQFLRPSTLFKKSKFDGYVNNIPANQSEWGN